LIFASRARLKLLTEFRLAATQRYTERPGFFKRLLAGNPQEKNDASPIAAAES